MPTLKLLRNKCAFQCLTLDELILKNRIETMHLFSKLLIFITEKEQFEISVLLVNMELLNDFCNYIKPENSEWNCVRFRILCLVKFV